VLRRRHTDVNVYVAESGRPQIRETIDTPPRPAPLLPRGPVRDLVERGEMIEQAVKALTAPRAARPSGRAGAGKKRPEGHRPTASSDQRCSVLLYGEDGTGKEAVMAAVLDRLAQQGMCGYVLDGSSDASRTLAGVYATLAAAIFGGTYLRVAEETLRVAVSELDVIIAIADCELGSGDVERLLRTFPHCGFLLTSSRQTLLHPHVARQVPPLSKEACGLLLAQVPGALPDDALIDLVYRRTGGKPRSVLSHAAALSQLREHPSQRPNIDEALISTDAQVELLAGTLSEPARRTLRALALVNVAVAPAQLHHLTGLSLTAEDERKLTTAYVVEQRVSGELRIAADARRALRAQADGAHGPERTRLDAVAAAPPADLPPALALAMARALASGGGTAGARRLLKHAVMRALILGRPQLHEEIVAFGAQLAREGGTAEELDDVFNEERTRALLHGDRAAVAGALLYFAQMQEQQPDALPAPAASATTGQYLTNAAVRIENLPGIRALTDVVRTNPGAVRVSGIASVTVAALLLFSGGSPAQGIPPRGTATPGPSSAAVGPGRRVNAGGTVAPWSTGSGQDQQQASLGTPSATSLPPPTPTATVAAPPGRSQSSDPSSSRITVDATGLSSTETAIRGHGTYNTATAFSLDLPPGDYSIGFPGELPNWNWFPVRVLPGATVDYDAQYDGVLAGRGTATLRLVGAPLGVDLTGLSHASVGVSGAGWHNAHQPQHLRLMPGSYQLDLNNYPANEAIPFTLSGSGVVGYSGDELTGAGTGTLGVNGHSITVNVTNMPYTYVGVTGAGWYNAHNAQPLRLASGTYMLLVQDSSGNKNVAAFSIGDNGAVDYSDSAAQYLTGKGTATLGMKQAV
jgi:hypothetical protein